MSLRQMKIFTLIFATFLATGHCTISDIISNLFTSKTKSSHCSGHGEENKTPGNHHSSCKDNGCCQPLLRALEVGSGDVVTSYVSFVWLPVERFAVTFGSTVAPVRLQLPLPNAPPVHLQSYISSLQYAPNAPPILS